MSETSNSNKLLGNMTGYPSFMANPAVPMVRYMLQRMLGKFLQNGITLSPADLSMADISLNDLEFNCQVSQQNHIHHQLYSKTLEPTKYNQSSLTFIIFSGPQQNNRRGWSKPFQDYQVQRPELDH